VLPNATSIPWTRRRSQILNFLHRGPVTFNTLVYDTNVGDISSLATYFNPDRISERELNLRFGHSPNSSEDEKNACPQKIGDELVVKPRLLLYPDHNLNSSQVKVQRTLNWVLTQDQDNSDSRTGSGHTTPSEPQTLPIGQSIQQGTRAERQNSGSEVQSVQLGLIGLRLASSDLSSNANSENKEIPPSTEDIPDKSEELAHISSHPLDTSLPHSTANLPCLGPNPKSFTLPTISLTTALDSIWAEKGVNHGLGLGGLIDRFSKSTDVLDKVEGGDRWWGAWDTAHSW